MRGALVLAACACAPQSEYFCLDGTECGQGGVCEPDGHCSFVDPSCPSGRRYGEHGGPLSDTCVSTDLPDATPVPDGPAACEEGGSTTLSLNEGNPTIFTADLSCARDDDADCGGAGSDLRYDFSLSDEQVVWFSAGTQAVLTVRQGACPGSTSVGCSQNPCGDLNQAALLLSAGPHCLIVDEVAPTGGQATVTVLPTGLYADPLAPGSDDYYSTCGEGNSWDSGCSVDAGEDISYYSVLCAGAYTVVVCPDIDMLWTPILSLRYGPTLAETYCEYNSGGCPAGSLNHFSVTGTTLLLTTVDGLSSGQCGDYFVTVEPG